MNGLNIILDKLGVYDLIGVLLTGVSICVFSNFIANKIYKFSFVSVSETNETFVFFFLSYFIGLIFQELGSLIQKLFGESKRMLEASLRTSDNYSISLTEIEKKNIFSYVESRLNIDSHTNNSEVIYNYCKFNITKNGNIARIQRDQSLSAMSRSFFIYFILLAFFIWFFTLYDVFLYSLQHVKDYSFHFEILIMEILIMHYREFVLICLSIILSLLCYRRYRRFAIIRYTYIFRTFYYQIVEREEELYI